MGQTLVDVKPAHTLDYERGIPFFSSFLFGKRRNPAAWALTALQRPLDAKGLLAGCFILSFVPVTFGHFAEHTLAVSIAHNSTQTILILLCFLILGTVRARLRWDTGAAIVAAFFVGAAQMTGVSHSPYEQKNYIMPAALPLLLAVGPIALSLARKMPFETLAESIAKTSKFLLAFFCVECATRYLLSPFVLGEPGFEGLERDDFYRYKQSIFFADSNSTGLALLCLTAILLIFRRYVSKYHVFLAYALVAATLSRASIIAAILQLFFYLFWRWRRLLLFATAVGAPIAIFLLLTTYITQGPDSLKSIDGSFATKFLILHQMASMWSQADILQRLVGIGVGNTQGVIGIAAHTLIATFALELGVAGSLLICVYIWLLCRRSSKTLYLLTVPIIVNGISLILPSMPFLYITFGILGVIKDSRTEASSRPTSCHEY